MPSGRLQAFPLPWPSLSQDDCVNPSRALTVIWGGDLWLSLSLPIAQTVDREWSSTGHLCSVVFFLPSLPTTSIDLPQKLTQRMRAYFLDSHVRGLTQGLQAC